MRIILGGDTETLNGEPLTFQFYSLIKKYQAFIWTCKKSCFKDFVNYCDSLPCNDQDYVVYIHNLKFDLGSFFYDRLELLRNEQIDFKFKNWTFKGVYANTTFLHMYHKSSHKTVSLIDTSAFFYGSLKKNAEIFCPETPKLDSPDKLGSKRFKKTDKKFIAYAWRDAEICYKIGLYIDGLHQEYEIPQTPSLPSMAQKIFRKNYMTQDIPQSPKPILYAALHSYHGGKNNITVPAGWYKNIYEIDINSAYPFAMSKMPSFYDLKLYKKIKPNVFLKKYPSFGVYRISGRLKDCKYPVIFSHNFKAEKNVVNRVWTTGFELNEALRSRELNLTEISGYCYNSEKDKNISPLKKFSEDFFVLKNQEKNPIKKMFYKILLNSLYGKFIQTIKKSENEQLIVDLDKEKLVVKNRKIAGGLFHPFIATLITGFTRAQIHRLEHKYQALHTSTDGIISYLKPKSSKKLGGISLKSFGNALILRNKLYIIYNNKKEIIKYALHGFHGTVETLEKCWKNKIADYEYTKVNKLKESLNRGLKFNLFETRTASLKNIPGLENKK